MTGQRIFLPVLVVGMAVVMLGCGSSSLSGGHLERGEDKYEQGDLEGAIAELTRAIELDPEDAVAHYNLGHVVHDLCRAPASVDPVSRLLQDRRERRRRARRLERRAG